MTPAGYLAKRVQKPKGFRSECILDVYSVSNCVNEDFADDYIQYWRHNGYWLFDSPETIQTVAGENSIQLEGTCLFYYEVHEMQFDGEKWSRYDPEASFPINVVPPANKKLEGFDVVTFFAGNAPECSPLSCNSLAEQIRTNEHCHDPFDEAYDSLSGGSFNGAEPGPYRIFAFYSVDWSREVA